MISAGSNSSLTTTDVVDAGTSEERAVTNQWWSDGCRRQCHCGKEVTVDVVVQGLASAAKPNTSISRFGEPTKEIGRSIPVRDTPGAWFMRARAATWYCGRSPWAREGEESEEKFNPSANTDDPLFTLGSDNFMAGTTGKQQERCLRFAQLMTMLLTSFLTYASGIVDRPNRKLFTVFKAKDGHFPWQAVQSAAEDPVGVRAPLSERFASTTRCVATGCLRKQLSSPPHASNVGASPASTKDKVTLSSVSWEAFGGA
jgi:hypothetical protein